MRNAYDVVRMFEAALCEYTGAKYAVTVNSCTMALLLAAKWHVEKGRDTAVTIPKHTYVSVPMSIIHAGGKPLFEDLEWFGAYRLKPWPVWDSAREFGKDMMNRYPHNAMVCVSFHTTKILGDTQGGAILLDNPVAYHWLKRMRFDGRTEGYTPKDDVFREIGYHCYMSPDVAARLLHKLSTMGSGIRALPNDDYPDLSQLGIFK